MTHVKIFEVRDRATFIPVMVIEISVDYSHEGELIQSAGYGPAGLYLYSPLDGAGKNKISYDRHSWGDESLGTRTHGVAHGYIEDNWHALEGGEVIDVEFILGETKEKKTTDIRI